MLVSIILPIYNAQTYLQECLESIARQTEPDFEVICINDGSTDNSLKICEEQALKDARFRVYSQRNQGVSIARNVALSKANGTYIVFIDADDIVDRCFLERLLLQSEKGYFAICSYTRTLASLGTKATKERTYEIKDFIRRILNESIEHPNIWMMMFRNVIIKEHQLRFTQGCIRNEDMEFYIRYMLYESKVSSSNYKGYYYRDNACSASNQWNVIAFRSYVDADNRISEILVNNDVVDSNNLIVPSTIQYFAYKAARHSNEELYGYIHKHYDMRSMMAKMLLFPRLARKGVAFCYLLLGRGLFYKVISM